MQLFWKGKIIDEKYYYAIMKFICLFKAKIYPILPPIM